MKICRLMVVTVFMIVLAVAFSGCEYDGPTAVYYQEHPQTTTPVITALNPAEAVAGFNYITIVGQNFSTEAGKNKVYFDGSEAEIVSESATSLTVRRPNRVGDSTTAKVVAYDALAVASFKPYKITPVVGLYGSFLNDLALSAVAVDQAENVYVVETASRSIIKITPDGQQTSIDILTAANVNNAPTDAKLGPDGKLYFLRNHRSIAVYDPLTREQKEWRRCPTGKIVRFGDFDAEGYFYAGGTRSDLVIIAPDSTFEVAGVYLTSTEILAVRVAGGYVYVASRLNAQTPAIITRHSLNGGGKLGPQELVIDLGTTAFASRLIKSLAIASNGAMFIGTDAPDPMLIADRATGSVDVFYKNILPSYLKQSSWGNGNYLYLIRGDNNLGEVWTLYRVDLGTTTAPY